ncbi:MAG: hypothetical protein KIT08_10540 [Anaerolineales bacterium]|nr:MAG: hypothetical protein KIT08_10540 [Anaerolineales bacterium]
MKFVKTIQQFGQLLFLFMWFPFTCIFAGMAAEMFGDVGIRFAAWVDNYLPGLISIQPSGLSRLSEIALTITIGLSIVSMLLIFGAPALAGILNRRVLQTGKAATASIVSMTQTGTYINNNPMVRFVLEVEPGDASPFHAETERLVQLTELGSLKPGDTVSVRYNPETNEVAISSVN